METLRCYARDFVYFIRVFYLYFRKRIARWWSWFEAKKNIVVEVLVAKRGTYQRPFLHTSLFVIIAVAVVALPVIANSYSASAQTELNDYTPPSAVLSSLDDQGTATQVSDKPRDKVISYKVETGDTLSTIAEKFGVTTDTVKWANPELKGEKVVIGQEISIPPVTGLVIKVTKGETIYSIAKKYKTEAQKILNWPFNDFADLDNFTLLAGQFLVIPDGVMPEAQPVYSPQMIASVGAVPGSGQFIWPTQGTISQRPVSYHMALDIANRSLPPIYASDAGKVVKVERARYGYGWHVIIDHQNGFQTLYGHMSDIYVSEGQGVSKGSVIGKVGSTGRSTGPHLHFEIRKNGVLLNPLSFLQ